MVDAKILNLVGRLAFEHVIVPSGVLLLVEADLPEEDESRRDKDCGERVVSKARREAREKPTEGCSGELELVGGVVVGCLVGKICEVGD